mmetsp:Transcript_29452/g.83937  ORF Transcript_29452/g.83937 Transcript_29452/m.83937 type:complete len:208 (-) Transcript_29452:166-789(-)
MAPVQPGWTGWPTSSMSMERHAGSQLEPLRFCSSSVESCTGSSGTVNVPPRRSARAARATKCAPKRRLGTASRRGGGVTMIGACDCASLGVSASWGQGGCCWLPAPAKVRGLAKLGGAAPAHGEALPALSETVPVSFWFSGDAKPSSPESTGNKSDSSGWWLLPQSLIQLTVSEEAKDCFESASPACEACVLRMRTTKSSRINPMAC